VTQKEVREEDGARWRGAEVSGAASLSGRLARCATTPRVGFVRRAGKGTGQRERERGCCRGRGEARVVGWLDY
jgi:hypothetical protein